MSSLSACYLVYAALIVPLLATAVWSMHRHSAPLLIDLLDADEMVCAAVHRLVTVAYALLGLGVAATLLPTAADVRTGAPAAVAVSCAGLLLVLGTAHAGIVAAYLGVRWRRDSALSERHLEPSPWLPPTRSAFVGSPARPAFVGAPARPAFLAPPPYAPPRPTYLAPPPPPPWCRPVPLSSTNPWAPPIR